MQVKTTNESPTKLKIIVIANEADIKPFKDHAVKELGQNVKLAGFRPGKAPAAIIEKNIDPSLLQSETMESAINHFYAEIIKKDGLRPVAQPEVSIKKFVPFTTLEIEIQVTVVGKITVPDYKKMKLPQPKVTVDAADIAEVLESLRERIADREEVKTAAKMGDQVTLDFKGTDEKGKAVNGAEGKDYPLVLGSNSFIPGFEDNVVGLKAGESKKFDIVFPKDYGVAALASKKVTFEITANKVEALKQPKLDDEFAAKAGPFKTLKELKDDIKVQLTAERQQAADREYQNELLQAIAAKSKVDVPESLVEEQLDAAEREERQNLMYRGQTWEEHLKEEGVTEEEHRKRNRVGAKDRVKAGLVLSEISELEKLDVTGEELENRVQMLKSQYQDEAMRAELDKPENRRDIAMRILSEKTINKLVEYANKK